MNLWWPRASIVRACDKSISLDSRGEKKMLRAPVGSTAGEEAEFVALVSSGSRRRSCTGRNLWPTMLTAAIVVVPVWAASLSWNSPADREGEVSGGEGGEFFSTMKCTGSSRDWHGRLLANCFFNVQPAVSALNPRPLHTFQPWHGWLEWRSALCCLPLMAFGSRWGTLDTDRTSSVPCLLSKN